MPPPFSDTVMEHFLRPRNAGSLPAPCGEGWAGSVAAARYMRIQVRLQGDRVAEARFGTYGCAPAIAAGSWLTEWVTGRSVAEARAVDAAWLEACLGGLPEARRDCAALAVDALHAALAAAQEKGDPA